MKPPIRRPVKAMGAAPGTSSAAASFSLPTRNIAPLPEDAAEHVAVEHENEAAEHAFLGDPEHVGEVAAQDLGQSLVMGHGALLAFRGAASVSRGGQDWIGREMSERDSETGEAPAPAIVLVRPQMGENIGAAARAMLNFGLDRMRLVAPRDGWPNSRAVAMASGAGRVLDGAGVFDDLGAALGDCDFVFATTARGRELAKPVLSPERAMEQARALAAAGKKVGVMFGPERAGLENEDIARANAIITFPVNPEFFSLNLAQSVLLLAYEWRRQGGEVAHEVLANTEFASGIEVEKLADHWEAELDRAGFFFPETKAAGMKLVLRNMWSRMPLTRSDAQILHGILRQMVRWKERGD